MKTQKVYFEGQTVYVKHEGTYKRGTVLYVGLVKAWYFIEIESTNQYVGATPNDIADDINNGLDRVMHNHEF